jgi:hypothetical protein
LGDPAANLGAAPLQDKTPKEEAAPEAKAAVIVLHASNAKKGIDARLPDDVKGKLKVPPFSSYDSYELLEKKDLDFSAAKAGELALPNKGKLKLSLNGVNKKYDLNVLITAPDGDKFVELNGVKAKRGDIFFIAGQKHKDGILVLGLRVGPNARPNK